MLLLLAKILGYSVLTIVAAVLWKFHPIIIRQFTSPLRNLPGPPNDSWLKGNGKAIQEEDNSVPQERWAAEAGSHTITYKGVLSVSCELLCVDPPSDSAWRAADGPVVDAGYEGG